MLPELSRSPIGRRESHSVCLDPVLHRLLIKETLMNTVSPSFTEIMATLARNDTPSVNRGLRPIAGLNSVRYYCAFSAYKDIH